LRQDTQQQQLQAPQTDGKSVRYPEQQYLPQEEIQKRGPSVQAPSSSDSGKLMVATVVRQLLRELNEAVKMYHTPRETMLLSCKVSLLPNSVSIHMRGSPYFYGEPCLWAFCAGNLKLSYFEFL
jgi:hypothetical protein